jgi:hypothetical protein
VRVHKHAGQGSGVDVPEAERGDDCIHDHSQDAQDVAFGVYGSTVGRYYPNGDLSVRAMVGGGREGFRDSISLRL